MDDVMAMKRTVGGNAKVKMKRKAYEKELRKLQVELCHLQDWVKETGSRIILVFEGRDAAGKGGTIKAITERVSPRGFCSEQEHRRFLELCPQIEKYIVDAGIQLIKIWLEVGQDEQERRFKARID